ncbi:EAL domain-containing protein [Enterobacter roggenkampii]|nr:EAL domain-containing protein [Enterobacter roggenkampii]
MFSRKIKGWIRPGKRRHNLLVLFLSLFLSGFFFFMTFEGVAYLIFRDKIKDFTSDVLIRAESLLQQTESVRVAAKAKSEKGDRPCSHDNLQYLRGLVWPYPLIKDVGYITKGGLTCSALWGNLRAPFSLDRFDKKWFSRNGLWLFGVQLQNNITTDGYISEGVMVIISPFAFRRFETDAHTKRLSAVIGNAKHDRHYFKIGPDAVFLDRHDGLSFKYRVFRSCSLRYDLCVAGGGYFTGALSGHWSVVMLLLASSLISGIMIYIIIMNRSQFNSSLPVRFVKALRGEGLSLVYQPIYRINGENICGFEVLLRWKDEILGHIGPDVFIPISERQGLQEEVSLYVLIHAIKEFIHIAIQNKIFLSLNINANDLNSGKFRETLVALVSEYTIPSGTVLLEITERQGGDFKIMSSHIKEYKNHGISFAIDDFGTGYSNLNLVKALDVDEIKIDKSLTDAIGTESLSYNLLPGLYEMFRNISDKIVFEGVETLEQVNYLKKFWPQSCAQGWFYSRALPLEEAAELIIRQNTQKLYRA